MDRLVGTHLYKTGNFNFLNIAFAVQKHKDIISVSLCKTFFS